MSLRERLLVVSNRLPFSITQKDGQLHIEQSSGGLVSALLPIFREMKGGCWIGWPGTSYSTEIDRAVQDLNTDTYSLRPVYLSPQEKACFYHGYSNEIIWPLFHDLQSRCNFNPEYWTVYRDANEKFAAAAAEVAQEGDFIWVHDYHLMLFAKALRAQGFQNEIAYFHHIPFPPPDIFEKLPWRTEILRALLKFDSIGLQTDRDRKNFLSCVRRLIPNVHIQKSHSGDLIQAEGICTRLGSFPIGIDFQDFVHASLQPGVEQRMEEIRQEISNRRLILGVDRLDYTKGILERLAAYRFLLRSRPELHGQVLMIQVAVPSREEIPEYHALKEQVERLIQEINEEFNLPDWSPILYRHESISKTELLALYRLADVALVTPLKDGMNLVAKEFCASRIDNRGVLVLSEFAGAAAELAVGAILVNPYDSEGVASALYQALWMRKHEQTYRMEAMRAAVAQHDVFKWSRALCSQQPLARRHYRFAEQRKWRAAEEPIARAG